MKEGLRGAGGCLRPPEDGGVWPEAVVFGCLLLAASIGLSPFVPLLLGGSVGVIVVPVEPQDLLCSTGL